MRWLQAVARGLVSRLPGASDARPERCQGVHWVPHVRPGPPLVLRRAFCSRRPSSVQPNANCLRHPLCLSRLLMPEDSLIPDLAVRTYVLLLLASPRADHSCSQPWRRSIFGPLFLPVTIVKTSTPLASTSLAGSAVINVGHSTRSSAQGRLHRYAENMFGASPNIPRNNASRRVSPSHCLSMVTSMSGSWSGY